MKKIILTECYIEFYTSILQIIQKLVYVLRAVGGITNKSILTGREEPFSFCRLGLNKLILISDSCFKFIIVSICP